MAQSIGDTMSSLTTSVHAMISSFQSSLQSMMNSIESLFSRATALFDSALASLSGTDVSHTTTDTAKSVSSSIDQPQEIKAKQEDEGLMTSALPVEPPENKPEDKSPVEPIVAVEALEGPKEVAPAVLVSKEESTPAEVVGVVTGTDLTKK